MLEVQKIKKELFQIERELALHSEKAQDNQESTPAVGQDIYAEAMGVRYSPH